MGLTKWLFTGLGALFLSWTGAGPLGALLGYLIGSAIENKTGGGLGADYISGGRRGPYHNEGTQDDINVSLLVLIAAVMKADGAVKRSELDYVKQFLMNNYGEEQGKKYLSMLRELVKPETPIPLEEICYQIKQNTDYTTRYHMVDFLFGLAVSDNSYSGTENSTMKIIARGLGINSGDYVSIYTRHVGSRYAGQNNYSHTGYGGYSGGSRQYGSSGQTYKDPYKVLGLTSSATDEEVKKAYRRLAM